MIEYKTIRAGQARAYEDSVYEYEITASEDMPAEEVKEYCLTVLSKMNPENEKPGYRHDGHCGWPFGLDSFYSFTKISPGKYNYTITSPYCD